MASVYLMIHNTESANIYQESNTLSRKLVKLIMVRVCNLTFETFTERHFYTNKYPHTCIAEWARA